MLRATPTRVKSPNPTYLPCQFWGLNSDEALAGSLKEILGVSTRPLHDPRIVAVFDFRFLKYKFHSDLRCVSSLYEHPGTVCESGATGCEWFFLSCRLWSTGMSQPSVQAVTTAVVSATCEVRA